MISFLLILLWVVLVAIGLFLILFSVEKNANDEYKVEFEPNWRGAPFLFAGIVIFFLHMSWTTVDAGDVGVVKLFGRPTETIPAGAHFINPLSEVTPITVQRRIVKPSENAASHDLQIVHVEVTFAYHIDPAFAAFVLTELNNDAETRVINPAVLEAIKATCAKYDVRELVGQRAKVRDGIEDMVKLRILPNHIVADDTSITDFTFSKEFEDAIEAKVTAEQQAEKAKNDLVRIQTEADQKVATAKGEAEALRVQKEQITPQLLQLRTIEMVGHIFAKDGQWNGAPPQSLTLMIGKDALPILEMRK